MSTTLLVQLLVAVIGQLPEIAKIIEELHATGATHLNPDQLTRVQAACASMLYPMKELWP